MAVKGTQEIYTFRRFEKDDIKPGMHCYTDFPNCLIFCPNQSVEILGFGLYGPSAPGPIEVKYEVKIGDSIIIPMGEIKRTEELEDKYYF